MTRIRQSRSNLGRMSTVGALTLALLVPAGGALAHSKELAGARAGTARYHRIEVARQAGYGLLVDTAGISCIDNPGVGAMGIHYVKGDLVSNPTVEAATPEALIYQRKRNGRLRLVAVEYVVLQSAWAGAGNTAQPSLFGHQFALVASPNRYGLPPFYELHAWIWKNNPLGMFNDWNPRVHCAAV